ncbi:hypothetical protein BDF14DRAFT_1885912 [Spinellus fusiger]|nr:hypothetical protein BDF14DRAFT_1885912 [Spinellus fusiger]
MSSPNSFSSTLKMQGWLLVQRQGFYKTYTRRFFVLTTNEMICFKHETDTAPQTVIQLHHYQLDTTNTCPETHYSFQLISEESNKSKYPDISFQTDSKESLEAWLESFQRRSGCAEILQKWLERYDIPTQNSGLNVGISPSDSTDSIFTDRSQTPSCYFINAPYSDSLSTVESSTHEKPTGKLASFLQSFWLRKSRSKSLAAAGQTPHDSTLPISTSLSMSMSMPIPIHRPIIHPSEFNQEDTLRHPYAI